MKVLKLNQQGIPSDWLNHTEAATLIVKNQVVWSLGDGSTTVYGGVSKSGLRSVLDIPAIIATKGRVHSNSPSPTLSNTLLFRRDNYRCLYCGNFFSRVDLTRDHIIPRGQGGKDLWMNVVAACKGCNNRKGCRTPEQANMPLLAVPFTPNPYEYLFLSARAVNEDQLVYLSSRWRDHRQWAA